MSAYRGLDQYLFDPSETNRHYYCITVVSKSLSVEILSISSTGTHICCDFAGRVEQIPICRTSGHRLAWAKTLSMKVYGDAASRFLIAKRSCCVLTLIDAAAITATIGVSAEVRPPVEIRCYVIFVAVASIRGPLGDHIDHLCRASHILPVILGARLTQRATRIVAALPTRCKMPCRGRRICSIRWTTPSIST